jgi:hypothetical protein
MCMLLFFLIKKRSITLTFSSYVLPKR